MDTPKSHDNGSHTVEAGYVPPAAVETARASIDQRRKTPFEKITGMTARYGAIAMIALRALIDDDPNADDFTETYDGRQVAAQVSTGTGESHHEIPGFERDTESPDHA